MVPLETLKSLNRSRRVAWLEDRTACARSFLLDRGLPPGLGPPALEIPQAPRNTNLWTQASAQLMLPLSFASGPLALSFISSSSKFECGIPPAGVLFHSVLLMKCTAMPVCMWAKGEAISPVKFFLILHPPRLAPLTAPTSLMDERDGWAAALSSLPENLYTYHKCFNIQFRVFEE